MEEVGNTESGSLMLVIPVHVVLSGNIFKHDPGKAMFYRWDIQAFVYTYMCTSGLVQIHAFTYNVHNINKYSQR